MLFQALMWLAAPSSEINPQVAAEMQRRKVLAFTRAWGVIVGERHAYCAVVSVLPVDVGFLFAAVAYFRSWSQGFRRQGTF